MIYYKDTKGKLYADPSDSLIQSLGLTEELSPVRDNGIVLPKHKNIGLLPVDDSGSLYKYYLKDSEGNYLPDFDRINKEILEVTIRDGERIVKEHVQKVIDDYNEANGIRLESIVNCTLYKDDSSYPHQQFCIDVLAFNAECWVKARKTQEDILSGSISLPTEEEFIAMLPVFGT